MAERHTRMLTLLRTTPGQFLLVEEPAPGKKGRVAVASGKGPYNHIAKKHGFMPGKYYVLRSGKNGKVRVIRPKP
jgi:hypothetical protein